MYPMTHKALLLATLVAVVAASSGCGRGNPAVVRIRGKVTDLTGAPIAGAHVSLRYQESALRYIGPAVEFARRDSRSTYTDSTGSYRFEFRPGIKVTNCATFGIEVRVPLYQMAIQELGQIRCTEDPQIFDFQLGNPG